MVKHYLTLEELHQIEYEFWADPSTEDMDQKEFMSWKGWSWDDAANKYYKMVEA